MQGIAKIFIGVFGAVGLGLLTGAFFALKSELRFRHEAVTVSGVVVENEYRSGRKSRGTWYPVFEYADKSGATHRVVGGIGSSPAAYDKGDPVQVRYKSENPGDARIASFRESWFLVLILGGLGSVFSAIAGGFLAHEIRKRRMRAWLADNGMRVQAKFAGVDLDRSLTVNGRHPWRINAQWQHPVTGLVHVFSSDSLWFDPTPFVTRDTIDVKVDADDPKRYHMDIAFLPKNAS